MPKISLIDCWEQATLSFAHISPPFVPTNEPIKAYTAQSVVRVLLFLSLSFFHTRIRWLSRRRESVKVHVYKMEKLVVFKEEMILKNVTEWNKN